MSAWHADRGGIVVGWLVRLTLVLGVFGLLAFDAIALGVGKMSLADDADTVARAAQDAWKTHHNTRTAMSAAQIAAEEQGITVDLATMSVGRDGSISFVASHQVPTMLLAHLPRAQQWSAQSVVVDRPAPVS